MKKNKLNKIITILTITCGFIAFISTFSSSLLSLYLSYKFNKDIRNESSIGIIGGADGPTAIYLSRQAYAHLIPVIFGGLAILGIIYLLITKNSIKKQK